MFNIYVLKMKPMDAHGMGEGYEKTKFKKANDELTQAGISAVLRVLFMAPIMMMRPVRWSMTKPMST